MNRENGKFMGILRPVFVAVVNMNRENVNMFNSLGPVFVAVVHVLLLLHNMVCNPTTNVRWVPSKSFSPTNHQQWHRECS